MLLNEKIALMRIATDLVKADEIIDFEELERMNVIEKTFGITVQQCVDAQEIAFSDAIAMLATLPQHEVDKMVAALDELSLSDGSCTTTEAILLISVRRALQKSTRTHTEVMKSLPDIHSIAPLTVVYVESQYDEAANRQIGSTYNHISNELRLAGFNFIYIPRLTESYRHLGTEFIESVISNIAPGLKPTSVSHIASSLCNITTADFCRRILVNKMGISDLKDTKPSLLIKIGESMVINKRPCAMSEQCDADGHCSSTSMLQQIPEYLLLRLDMAKESIEQTVHNFVEQFHSLLSNDRFMVECPRSGERKFRYSGFHKTLVDMLVFPGNKVESDVLIDVRQRSIVLTDLDEELKIPAHQRTLYSLLLLAQAVGRTINITDPDGSVNRAFSTLYEWIGKDDTDARPLDKGITQNLSKIRSAVAEIAMLKNRTQYTPIRKDDTVTLGIPAQKIFILDKGATTPIPLAQCSRWTKLLMK